MTCRQIKHIMMYQIITHKNYQKIGSTYRRREIYVLRRRKTQSKFQKKSPQNCQAIYCQQQQGKEKKWQGVCICRRISTGQLQLSTIRREVGRHPLSIRKQIFEDIAIQGTPRRSWCCILKSVAKADKHMKTDFQTVLFTVEIRPTLVGPDGCPETNKN